MSAQDQNNIGYLTGKLEQFEKNFDTFSKSIHKEIQEFKEHIKDLVSASVTRVEHNTLVERVAKLENSHSQLEVRQDKSDMKLLKWGIIFSVVQVLVTSILFPIGLFVVYRFLGHWIDSLFK